MFIVNSFIYTHSLCKCNSLFLGLFVVTNTHTLFRSCIRYTVYPLAHCKTAYSFVYAEYLFLLNSNSGVMNEWEGIENTQKFREKDKTENFLLNFCKLQHCPLILMLSSLKKIKKSVLFFVCTHFFLLRSVIVIFFYFEMKENRSSHSIDSFILFSFQIKLLLFRFYYC